MATRKFEAAHLVRNKKPKNFYFLFTKYCPIRINGKVINEISE